jgi:hypothetical protein
VDLGGSAIAHALSVFLARNSKINKKMFGAALILGVGGDNKHKYFFICPNVLKLKENHFIEPKFVNVYPCDNATGVYLKGVWKY